MNTVTKTNPTWKKYFYSGVGFVANTKDIVQKSMEDVVKHGKVSEAEGRKIVDAAAKRLETSYNEAVHKLGALSGNEISKLKSQVDKLEKQLSVKTAKTKTVKALTKTVKALPIKKAAFKKAAPKKAKR